MAVTKADILAEIDAIFSALGAQQQLVSDQLTAGKMYEAWVLAHVLDELHRREGFEFRLVGGTKPVLKASPGPINTNYPHFEGECEGRRIAVWTDIEFRTFSFFRRSTSPYPDVGDKHELDIVVVPSGTIGYPAHDEILWGIECKHTAFQKHMARAALGVRRELSLLASDKPTFFRRWPTVRVPAGPPSVVTVYSTSSAVTKYRGAGGVFGIDFTELPLPR